MNIFQPVIDISKSALQKEVQSIETKLTGARTYITTQLKNPELDFIVLFWIFNSSSIMKFTILLSRLLHFGTQSRFPIQYLPHDTVHIVC